MPKTRFTENFIGKVDQLFSLASKTEIQSALVRPVKLSQPEDPSRKSFPLKQARPAVFHLRSVERIRNQAKTSAMHAPAKECHVQRLM
jgi:hypothetical protein